jgi:hypothetical protein
VEEIMENGKTGESMKVKEEEEAKNEVLKM